MFIISTNQNVNLFLILILQIPIINLAISAFMCALIALFFDLEKLVEFMSIGTLLAYTIVSASVIILRYRPTNRGLVRDSSSLLELPTSQADVSINNKFIFIVIKDNMIS